MPLHNVEIRANVGSGMSLRVGVLVEGQTKPTIDQDPD